MPAKPRIFTSEFPYHIRARTNNREPFPIPLKECFEIFIDRLDTACDRFGLHTHAFTLMNNHYHLVASASAKFDLGYGMNWIEMVIAKDINRQSGRMNHVWGGPYRETLITNPYYYGHAIRYAYQNPVRAGICLNVEDYPFSTVRQELIQPEDIGPRIILPTSGIGSIIHALTLEERLAWFNKPIAADELELIRKGFKKAEFKVSPAHNSKKPHWLSHSLDALRSKK